MPVRAAARTRRLVVDDAVHRVELLDALRAAERLTSYTDGHPLDYVRWTPPQLAWLSLRCARKLLRAGNQIGKTWAGLAEVIWRATGTHPYQRTKPPPVEIWIVCTTWPQSVQIMKKFWQLLPKELVRNPKTFDPRYGFGKDNPAVVFECGSIVRFKTTCQGAEALAGATVDYILIDEPTSEEVYRELDRRLTRTGGDMGLTLTPLNRPCEYIRKLVAEGAIREIHAKLTVANLTPAGSRDPLPLLDGTLMDERWIAEQRRLVLPRFAPVILDGHWETRLEGRAFEAYDPGEHMTEELPDIDLHVALGFDWGEGFHRTYTSIAGVDLSGIHPRVHFLGEVASDGMRPREQDALEVLDELDECAGWTWADVATAWGDKPTTGRVGRLSNKDMMAALERELRARKLLGRRQPLHPRIRQAKTGKNGNNGSMWRGVDWLHQAMVRPGHFTIHPRCEVLHEALTKWCGDEEFKDPVDGARYATWPFAMRGGVRGPNTYLRMAIG